MCSVGGKPSFVGTINVFIYTSTSDINNEYSLRVYVYVWNGVAICYRYVRDI